ncbi:MAG: hypothetical protein KJ069_26055, partial [Anaerolineae bacterium]|nr:hypothetical protein [Anaerolineae bacterium]
MSRRQSDSSGDAALGCLFIIGFIFYKIWQSFQTPLLVQVRRLNRPVYWGTIIEAFSCATCQAANEPGRDFCFHCGKPLVGSTVGVSKSGNSGG